MTRRSRALILVTGTIAALTGWSGCRLAAEPAWMALTDRPLDGFHARKLERDALRERYDAKATRLRERARALEVRIAAALTALDAAALAEAMQTYHDWALLLRLVPNTLYYAGFLLFVLWTAPEGELTR